MCCANVSCAYLLGVDDLTFEDSDDDPQGARGGAFSSGGGSPSGGKGGAGGTAGTAGTATGATGGTSTGTNCVGRAGPVPVNIEGMFCIDSTEVTNAQYAQFLASGPPAPTDAACAWNFDYTPSDGWPASNPNLPVGYVDWCDARGYCAWAGKRLCGAIGGGLVGSTTSLSNEIYYACSHAGDLVFPYGNMYAATACATDFLDSARPVGSSPGCEGGFPGVFDLSGNAAEWQDTCEDSVIGEEYAFCHLGSYGYRWIDSGNPPGADFTCRVDQFWSRSTVREDTGIRCCSDST